LVLLSFLAQSKPKILFHGLFLLRNQTETLATQATEVVAAADAVAPATTAPAAVAATENSMLVIRI